MREMSVRDVRIQDVHVAERIRRENGDLEELAKDIREHGLLNPITVMAQASGGYMLIAAAAKAKGGGAEWRRSDPRDVTVPDGALRKVDAGDRRERTAQGIHGQREADVCGETAGG